MGSVFLQDGTVFDPQVAQVGKTSEFVQVIPISQFGNVQVQTDHFIQATSGFRYACQRILTQAEKFKVWAMLAEMIVNCLKVLDVVTGEKKLPQVGMAKRALGVF